MCLISTSTNLFTSELILSSKVEERKFLRENLERTWCPIAWASAAEFTYTDFSENFINFITVVKPTVILGKSILQYLG